MSIGSTVLAIVGVLIEVVLLWRILHARLWRYFPYFSVYIVYLSLETIVFVALLVFWPKFYPATYWIDETITMLFWFLLIWEVFRQAFSGRTQMFRIVSRILIGILCVLALTYAVLGGGAYMHRLGFILPDLRRQIGMVQLALLAVVLVTSRYYGIALTRNVWGMALGFGVYASVSVINFADYELRGAFATYVLYLRPVSFIAMIAVWTWAFWEYTPAERVLTQGVDAQTSNTVQWKHMWARAFGIIRRILQP